MGATMFTFLPFLGGCSRRRFSSRLLTVVVYAEGELTSRVAQVRLSSPICCQPSVLRHRWCAGSGAGAGDGDAVGDGGGREVEVRGGGSPGCIGEVRPSVRHNRLHSSACCGEPMLSREGVGKNEGLVKYQGRCITDWGRNYCAIDDEIW